jgi:hypothetical protein
MKADGNALSERQNSEGSIRLLCANCRFYGNGKRVLALQMFLTVGLAILLPLLIWIFPEFKTAAALIAITVAWLDVTAIDRLQIYYRKQGALGQERFDCDLFGIEWNDLRCGKQLPPESVHTAADAFLRSNSSDRLKDWYAVDLDALPSDLAALASQRLSLGWDCEQRLIFGYVLWGMAVVALIGVAFWAVCCAQTIRDTLLVTYASVAPAIIWCAREGRRHLDASRSIEKARAFADKTWKDAVSDKLVGERLQFTVRQIQDAMFENRSKNPMIFDWIYLLLRPVREKAMRLTASDLVSEWKTRGA